MKLSLFSIIGGTFYQFSDVPITEETLRQFEEEVGNKVTEKLSAMAPLLPSIIKITPELVVSEEHNGDVMVKDIILETKELAAASATGDYDNMMKELAHVAAVAIGAMEALMRAKAQEGGDLDA